MSRDPLFLHPLIQSNLQLILDAIQDKLPAGITCKVISTYRTPAEQFELYKKGRTFRASTSTWVKTGATVTNIDGFRKLSNHNYLPCHALDIGLFQGAGYLGDSPNYKFVKNGAKAASLDWGGDWKGFKDRPHIEVPTKMLFKGNRVLDTALQWQKLLKELGAYTGALAGMFGKKSIAALKALTGTGERTAEAWLALLQAK